ncbi:MAG: biotin/lipoyl-containing protein [bacterium]
MRYIVNTGNERLAVEITDGSDGLEIKVNDKPVSLSLVAEDQYRHLLLLLDSRSYDTEVFRSNGRTQVFLLGRQFDCLVEDERLAKVREVAGAGAADSGAVVRAPMPGLVVRILKEVGARVKRGESLIIVEAMKMENELKAPATGKIVELHVKPGQAVDKGDLLVTME